MRQDDQLRYLSCLHLSFYTVYSLSQSDRIMLAITRPQKALVIEATFRCRRWWLALLAVIYAVPPVLWATCVMRKCKDNYSFFVRPKHKRKGKVLEEHTPSIFGCRRPCERVGEGARSCIFNRRKKSRAKPQLFGVVVGNLRKNLTPGRNNKACALHCRV